MTKPRVLVAEDESHLREVLRIQLESAGFEVTEACDGEQAVTLATQQPPDVVLLDVMMPQVDGYEACKRLRQALATRHLPIIMLTAKTTEQDKIVGLEGGANDYVTKPWQERELIVRVKSHLEWSRRRLSASPLTGLPGNVSINDELRRRLESGRPFALLQIDIDFFKAFNDHYGYARGDQAIQRLAYLVQEASLRHGGPENFLGHIGGDDFLVITGAEHAEDLGEEIISEFNRAVTTLYDPFDRERGYVEVRNRLHHIERFPLMSVTIALVSTDRMPITHLARLIDIAQELKAHGKGIPGSVLVGERRRQAPGTPPTDERDAA